MNDGHEKIHTCKFGKFYVDRKGQVGWADSEVWRNITELVDDGTLTYVHHNSSTYGHVTYHIADSQLRPCRYPTCKFESHTTADHDRWIDATDSCSQ